MKILCFLSQPSLSGFIFARLSTVVFNNGLNESEDPIQNCTLASFNIALILSGGLFATSIGM